jgi:poly-gamma-glutamate capsule biosynthesis protein CapA/YwtB (metallophosphatase superfamily)
VPSLPAVSAVGSSGWVRRLGLVSASAIALVGMAACSGSSGSGEAAPGTSSSTTAPPSTTTTAALRSFTIAASGDILLHTPVQASGRANAGGNGFDFNPMFDAVRALVSSADLAICHLETPLSADDRNLAGFPTFNVPHEIAPALAAAGFDACDTSSNHSVDRGAQGVKDTLDALDGAGIRHTGGARSAEEAASPPIYDVKGVKVGHLAYTFSYNGNPVPADAPWMAQYLWTSVGPERILADAHALKARGAEFVVVSIHWGAEYSLAVDPSLVALAHTLLASADVDLLLGDHGHVPQACEKVGDKYVEYDMGNFLSNQSPQSDHTLPANSQDGVIVRFQVEEVTPGHLVTTRMTFAPTFVTLAGHRILGARPPELQASHDRTVKALTSPPAGVGACDATPEY